MVLLRAVAVLCCLIASASAVGVVTTTVVDIPTRGISQRILYVHPDAPVANLVVLPGGDGTFAIRDDGSLPTVTGRCNPPARNRDALAGHNLAVALVDANSNGGVGNVNDILAVIGHMKARDDVPTWIIGGSSSTETVKNVAINLPAESPVGVILFSPDNISAQAALLTHPTLVVYHPGDPTQFGPAVFAALTAAPAKELISLSGGSNSGCGYHLFNGLDAEFVSATTGFIEKINPTLVANPPPGAALAVEFYNASLDHYFLTHIANEIALLDAGVTIKGWARTAQSFYVYSAAEASSSPVCRYYIPPDKGNSHFYGRGTAECTATGAANPTFVNEDPQFFHMLLPVAGVCPAGTRNVYRTFSNRADANHRYMIDPAVRDLMVTRGWLAEGDGAELVVMCSPV